MKKMFLYILVISILIRFIGINQSLWLDEAISANVVKNYSYSKIITQFSPNDFHPSGYYLVLKLWTSVVKNSELGMRSMSIVFALITIYMVYKIGGIWPAVLTGFNPLLVYYSQEVRMYSMVTMLVTIAIYFLVKKKYLWTSLFLGLSFLTFYGSIFLLGGIVIYLLINKKYKEIIWVVSGLILAFGLNWPLMRQQLINSKEMLSQVTNWSLVLGKVNLKNLLLIPMKFTSGRISFEPKMIYYGISGIWAIFVFSKLVKKNIYGLIFWITLAIGIIFSIFTPMLQYFRFLYLVPIMALAIGKNKIIAGGFLIFSLVYLLNPIFYREDWQSLVKELPNKVYMISSFGDPLKYYKNNILINDIKATINDKIITVIPYGEEIHGVDHNKILTGLGYKRIEIKNYRQLSAEKWSLMLE